MNKSLILILLLTTSVQARVVSLKDNLLFAFEKCKSLSVDLHKGQLIEAVSSSFDVVCKKVPNKPKDFSCEFFEAGSSKKSSESVFTGGSELGEGSLKDKNGKHIRFLIGKGFASFQNPQEHTACIGIFLFEKEALKKRAP